MWRRTQDQGRLKRPQGLVTQEWFVQSKPGLLTQASPRAKREPKSKGCIINNGTREVRPVEAWPTDSSIINNKKDPKGW
jgi:hypothetical protein